MEIHPELPAVVRDGILMGQPVNEMNHYQVRATFGEPDRELAILTLRGEKCTELVYGKRSNFLWRKELRIYLKQGVVKGFHWGDVESLPVRWRAQDGKSRSIVRDETEAVLEAKRLLFTQPSEAESRLVALAEEGYAVAAAELAHQYRVGLHLPKNPQLALRWATVTGSLEPPFGPGCFELYSCLSAGIGADPDMTRALTVLLRGKDSGHFNCAYEWASLQVSAAREGPFEKRGQALREAAVSYEQMRRMGPLQAEARRMELGEVAKSLNDRIDLRNVQNRLVDIYSDYAVQEYSSAASIITWQLEFAPGSGAKYKAAKMYLNGHGFEVNYRVAFSYMREASKDGYVLAYRELGRLYDLGRGVPENDLEANRWYRMAAAHCSFDGLGAVAMGRQFMEGEGVERDLVQAYAWIAIGAAAGYAGEDEKKELQSKMTTDQVNRAQQRALEIEQELAAMRENERAK